MASDSRAKLLREAEKYVLQGRISHAIGEYLKIVKSDPEDVLTLNTIGDLYLRQGRVGEANKLFLQVAENYTRNNFLLKAIAVYKKVLASDPKHLEINSTIADLYARQGLNVDARIQYLHVADLYAKAGRTEESLQAYEKAVAIDHSNANVQLKLAEIYLEQKLQEKAFQYFAGAARAQAKTGNHQAATHTYRRALELKPSDIAILTDYLESAMQIGDIAPVLEQLNRCLEEKPEEISLHELLGRAYLAAGELERSLENFRMAFAVDDSRYENFLAASNALVENKNYDRAAECLDPIVPILISRRETERAVAAYRAILDADPSHILTLTKLADLFSAINDESRYLGTLQKIADYYAGSEMPAEALEYIERILQINPTNEEYQQLHRKMFGAANPGTPYTAPAAVLEAMSEAKNAGFAPGDVAAALDAEPEQSADPKIVEIDLLLNYGMKEKALGLLHELEAQDPKNGKVRTRLIALYKDDGKTRLAAEQCLMMAALSRKSGDEERSQKHMLEAQKLEPEWVTEEFDLAAFAEEHGIGLDGAGARSDPAAGSLEVDLSGDLTEIFFKDASETADFAEDEVSPDRPEPEVEELASQLPPSPPEETIGDQLQEVDFYIRLGFQDEARSKLDEIGLKYPDHPELASRYEQLDGEQGPPLEESPIAPIAELETSPPEDSVQTAGPETPASDLELGAIEIIPVGAGDIQESSSAPEVPDSCMPPPMDSPDLGEEAHPSQENLAEQESHLDSETSEVSEPSRSGGEDRMPDFLKPTGAEARTNTMFADLIDEVNALTDQEILREDFETHFNLGIAYREMGLIDDAIKEFQRAVKVLDSSISPREVVQCCGMLSNCFLEKGMPRSAIRWCQTGLAVPDVSPHESTALQYDLGIAHSLEGDSEKALEWFTMIFDVDPSYRDVAQKIDDLKSEPGRHGG